MAAGLLPGPLQSSLEDLIDRVNTCDAGVNVILLSTSEGVPLGRVYSGNWRVDEETLGNLETTWAPASKLFPMLQAGEIRTVTAIYEQVTLLHIYTPPVVVTLLVSPKSNLGAIRATAIPLLKETLQPLCQTLLSSLSPDTAPESTAQTGTGGVGTSTGGAGYYQ